MKSLVGHLLIAPPQERDPELTGTVILVIQHSEEQALGVVLNRPTNMTVSQVWRGKRPCQYNAVVYSGGPVSGPLMALHMVESLGQIEVLPGVYYSVQKKLELLVHRPIYPMKILDSHVGWGPGQLERFLEKSPWRVLPATPQHIFHVGPDLWEELSKLA